MGGRAQRALRQGPRGLNRSLAAQPALPAVPLAARPEPPACLPSPTPLAPQGTQRGAAAGFKLDTLLKLADVKGTDRKTSLLHFVIMQASPGRRTEEDAWTGGCLRRAWLRSHRAGAPLPLLAPLL